MKCVLRMNLILGLLLWCRVIHSSGENRICEISFSTCPENFNTDTLVVPTEVVALSSTIFTCNPTEVIEGVVQHNGPPSIVFVIDHSYSMMGLGNTYPGNDTYGSRFNVTRDLIDTIYSVYPDAEIGLVVFREVLYFDHRNNQFFETLNGQGDQSYLPLLKLNATMKGSVSGLQAIRSVLKTDTIVEYNRYLGGDPFSVECVDLEYKPQFATIGNTNINNAFAAALQAMQKARYPAERRFIIFLSDGEPFPVNPTSKINLDSIYKQHGGREPFYFQQGLNTPTTFTVYLHNVDSTAPQSLQTMTKKIRDNNYSTSNKSSEIWTLKTNYDALMSLFMKRIITPILTVTSGNATSVVVNKVVSTSYNDNSFVFKERFPLSPVLSRFDISINYHLKNLLTNIESDTQAQTIVHVRRKENALLPEGIESNCWEKAQLMLYYGGQQIISVNETMDSLQIRFDAGNMTYDNVSVTVGGFAGQNRDSESFPLISGNQYWFKSFLRQIKEPLGNDGILQHQISDSIIVIYRNPKIPLDTIRLSVPFVISKNLMISHAIYNDRNADGFIDSVFIGVNGNPILNDISQISAQLILPAFRNFVLDSVSATPGGFAFHVKEKRSDPLTGVTDQDCIIVRKKILSGGGILNEGVITVQDNIAPVISSAILVTSGTLYDSIRVFLSEPVRKFSSQKPFLFSKADGQKYDVFLDPNGVIEDSVYSSLVFSVQSGYSIEQNDSVWINFVASISDSILNIQSNPDNRRVQLIVKQVPYGITPHVINNPFSPGQKIPLQVQNAYSLAGMNSRLDFRTGGMIIIVEPQTILRPHIILSGHVSIYDVVKNKVVENEPMIFDKEKQKLYFSWNGKNTKGRPVGTGTYMAVLEIADNQDLKESKTVRIGVKR